MAYFPKRRMIYECQPGDAHGRPRETSILKRQQTLKRPGLVTRYFLRRFAQAQRDGRGRAIAYTRALAEVIALCVLMPSIALFSLGAWVCLRLQPVLHSAADGRSPLAGILLVTFSLVLVGHIGLGRRLRRFRDDPQAARDFDTDHDREIMFWQKLIVTALCGFAAPLCVVLMMVNP